jgi:hypothetical protein
MQPTEEKDKAPKKQERIANTIHAQNTKYNKMREEEEVAIYIHSLTPSACNLRLIHSRSINRKEEVKVRCFSLKSLTVAWHSYLCNNHSFFCSNKQTTPTTSQGFGLRASNGKKESFPQ